MKLNLHKSVPLYDKSKFKNTLNPQGQGRRGRTPHAQRRKSLIFFVLMVSFLRSGHLSYVWIPVS